MEGRLEVDGGGNKLGEGSKGGKRNKEKEPDIKVESRMDLEKFCHFAIRLTAAEPLPS